MKLEQRIAMGLVEAKELTVSERATKAFRLWLVSKGGRCTPKGDVVTLKGGLVVFEKAAKPHAFRISLKEVTA